MEGAIGDDEGLSNLYEFGVGGNPINALDTGYSTGGELDGTSMIYIYPKHSASNSGVDYYLEITDDLIYGEWTNNSYTVTGTGTIDVDFDAVTNQISTEIKDEQFIRLIIEEL